MTKADFIKAMFNRLDSYREDGMEASVKRNNHMNEFQGTEWNQKFADEILCRYIDFMNLIPEDKWQGSPVQTSGEVLRLMSDQAIVFRNILRRDGVILEGNLELVDAVLVDFINHVGVRAGVDWAMYTKDLGA